jgi:membrane protein DedA with SNARE-associated domain
MINLLDPLLSFVLLYRYVGLFFLQFFSALGVPIPAATIVVAAAAFAGEGYLDITAVIGVAIAGNVLGDVTAFLLARIFGERALRALRLKRFLESPRAKRIEGRFLKHERITIVWSRFIGVATVAINIITGLGTVLFRRFIVWDFIGQTLSITAYALIGYFVGSDWESIATLLGHVSVVVLCCIVVGIMIAWQWRRKRIRRNGL